MARGGTVHIVAIDGEADEGLQRLPHTNVGWAQIGHMIAAFRKAGSPKLVIVGACPAAGSQALRPDLGFFLGLPEILRLIATRAATTAC